MASKGFQRFENRLVKFREDCELTEIIVANKERLKGVDSIFLKVTEDSHPLLSARHNASGSRNLIVTHLRNTMYVAYIKELYEELTEYLHYILIQGSQNGANVQRLVGEHNEITLSANEILSNNKKELDKKVMENIFRKLENERSTPALISKIVRKLGLDIDQQLINDALPYLVVRHVFVHSDGKPDETFRRQYPNIHIDQRTKRIQLNSEFASIAYNSVRRLIEAFDSEMEDRHYFSDAELQP